MRYISREKERERCIGIESRIDTKADASKFLGIFIGWKGLVDLKCHAGLIVWCIYVPLEWQTDGIVKDGTEGEFWLLWFPEYGGS